MGKSIKLSIVTAYYNRKELLLRTLLSISQSKQVDNLEVIIVDDGSKEEERLEDIVDNYPFPINLIRVNPEEKWYTNPCIPFNRGFRAAKGDKVIIQNPECYHVGDLIDHAINNVTEELYISYATYALSKEQTTTFGTCNLDLHEKKANTENNQGDFGWYNHSKISPRPYHFASCITKNNLNKMGGFSEEYALGDGFDDDDLIHKVMHELNLSVQIEDSVFVLHQNHYGSGYFDVDSSMDGFYKHPFRLWRNKNIYTRKVAKTHVPTKAKAKPFKYIPKKAHYYWEGDRFSYLHFLSVKSFIDKNPDWECIMHTNKAKVETDNDAWSTGEQKAVYTGKNYFDKLQELKITINEVDFEELGISPTLNPVHKSDLLRWYLLGTQGGAWIDCDILHTKPLSTLNNYMHKESDGCYCYSEMPINHFIIGFFLSKPNNPFFMSLFEEGKKEVDIDYQMYGNKLMSKLYGSEIGVKKVMPKSNMKNLYFESFYIHPWFEVEQLFDEKQDKYKDDHVVGIHWFNGDPRATQFCNTFDEEYDVSNPQTTIEEIINDSL